MFNDWNFDSKRIDSQQDRFHEFQENSSGYNILIIELGAGTAVPSIRNLSENLVSRNDYTRYIHLFNI